MTYREIFLVYLKIGLFTFGGGMMMLPLYERELSERRDWFSRDDVYEYFALGQSIPGLMGVNMAAFTGYRLRGVWGAVCAAGGIILPSFVIITIIAIFFRTFDSIPFVQSIFKGLNVAIIAILVGAIWKMARRSLTDVVTVAIFIVVFVVYFITGVNPAIFVITGALAGILLAERRRNA